MTQGIDSARLEEIARGIKQVHDLYNRLVLVVGGANADGLGIGGAVARRLALERINVGIELGERLLEMPARQRPLRVGRLLEDLVRARAGDAILLDNLEILFHASLRQDPLRLIQGLSRARTVVAMWSGTLEDGNLVYAVPGHPEHRSYPAADLLIVAADGS